MNQFPLYFPSDDLENICSRVDLSLLRGEKILLTGGTGFIGRWILESLIYSNTFLENSIEIDVLSRYPEKFLIQFPKYKNFDNLEFIQGDVSKEITSHKQYKYIIHAAANSDSRLTSRAAMEAIQSIATGTKNILDFSVTNKTKKILFISSGAVYGLNTQENIDEAYPGSPIINSINAYGESKRFAELLCNVYSELYSIDIVIARCFAFVGPGLPLNSNFAVGNFIQNTLEGKKIRVKGDGKSIRSYMYPSDLVVWLLKSFLGAHGCETYNVGSEEAVSIEELAKTVGNIGKNNSGYIIEGQSIAGILPDRYVPSNSKIRQRYSLEINFSLIESIEKTIEYFRKNI